jgi:hypothetical protein
MIDGAPVNVEDLGTGSAAFQAAVATEQPFVLNNSETVATQVNATGYFNFTGPSDSTSISVTASIGFRYAAAVTTFDDHDRKIMASARLTGNGTNTLVENAVGSYWSHRDMTYTGASVGTKIASYVNDGYKNHYRSNALYGLWLNGVTAYTEREIYARGHDNPSGAAVFISGANTENVRLSGGAIEGNRAPAIKVDSTGFAQNAFKLSVDSVYFEVDGDASVSTPSISIPSDMGDAAFARFVGCKLSRNTFPWTTGEYRLGKNAIFCGTTVAGDIYVSNASFVENTYLSDIQLNPGVEPILVHAFSQVAWDGGRNAVGGAVFSTPVSGKVAWKSPVTNAAPTTTPYVTASVTNAPTITVNSADDYGDGSWSRAAFTANVGTVGNNSVILGNGVTATGYPYRVHVFLAKSNVDQVYSLAETGIGGALSHTMELKAGKTYRIVCLTNRAITGVQALYMWPTTTAAPTLDVIMVYQALFADNPSASAFVTKIVNS